MRLFHPTVILACALGLVACKQQPTQAVPEPADTAMSAASDAAAPPPLPALTAVATLAPTQGSHVSGTVTFSTVDGHLHASGQLSGLTPNSEHGFHIHEKGDCSAPDGSSAGGHFNPAHVAHGAVTANPHHGGDMPNIVADAQGNAVVDGPVSSNVNIGNGDDFDILGRGLIVHADADDYVTQPTGNAGARLACGVIQRGH
ncbi:superoxide dismutase family protein [Stenotrophomonas sp. YIM B06876]|uniref:superoxide dismutase family protein n=1 Tax=Stenotrophomonas sp. YIM B06876 TaxID=3060211 RepID=UPI00273A2BBE|nr:superoxide dismutase family protein [Stenotrophomonas sp. YIM B06876]